jgi:hypothetical protein
MTEGEKDCINTVFDRNRKYLRFCYTYPEGRRRINISSTVHNSYSAYEKSASYTVFTF